MPYLGFQFLSIAGPLVPNSLLTHPRPACFRSELLKNARRCSNASSSSSSSLAFILIGLDDRVALLRLAPTDKPCFSILQLTNEEHNYISVAKQPCLYISQGEIAALLEVTLAHQLRFLS